MGTRTIYHVFLSKVKKSGKKILDIEGHALKSTKFHPNRLYLRYYLPFIEYAILK